MTTGLSILRSLQELLGEDINLSLVISSLRKSLAWVIFIGVFLFTLVFFYLRYSQPIFQSNATIIYKPDNSTAKLLGVDVLAAATEDVSLDIKFFKSKILLKKVVNNLPVDVRYFVEGRTRFISTEMYKSSPFKVNIYEIKNSEIYDRDIDFRILNDKVFEITYLHKGRQHVESFSFGKIFENELFVLSIEKTTAINDYVISRKYAFQINNPSNFANALIKNIEVEPVGDSRTIGIVFRGHDNIFCKDVVDELIKQYIILNKDRKSESADQIIAYLETKIDTFRVELSMFQDSIKLFMIENQFSDPENTLNNINKNLAELEKEKSEIQFKIKILNWFRNYLETLKDLRLLSTGIIENELSGYAQFIADLKRLEKDKDELLQKVTVEHPKVKMLNKELNQIREELNINLNNVEERLNFRLNDITSKQSIFNSALFALPEKEAEYNRLKRKYDMLEKYYISLLDKLAEYNIARQGVVSDYTILEQATMSTTPVAPDRLAIWGATIIAFIISSLLMMLARYVLHNTIISVEEIRRKTKAGFLGAIPTVQEVAGQSIAIYHNPKSVLSESFRTIRGNLQFINNREGSKIVSVTSSISGEGKTFVSTNLAGILSLLNKKVVLIDFDMRRPRLNKVFNVNNEKGTSTILINRDTIADCLHDTEISNLKVITSGPIPPNPAELILSENLDQFLKDLQKTFDYIVLDTPPIGLVTDGLELVKRADYPIYVFRADYSDKAFASNLNKLIDENHIKNLSFVLNDIGRGVSGYYYDKTYSYSYSYSYGYGAGYYVEAKVPKKKSVFSKWFGGQEIEE